MMFVCLFFLLTVIPGCSSQAYSQCPSFKENVKACTTKYITNEPSLMGKLDVSKPITIDSILTDKVTGVCTGENRILLKRFFMCIYLNYKRCMPAKFLPAFPAQAEYVASLDYLCDNVRDLDVPCMGRVKDELMRCVKERARSIVKTSIINRHMTTDDYIAIICRVYPAAEPCYHTTYRDCSGRTKDIVMTIYKRQTPTACLDDTAVNIQQQSTNAEDSVRVQHAFKHHGTVHNSIYEIHGTGDSSSQTASLCCLLLALSINWIQQTYL